MIKNLNLATILLLSAMSGCVGEAPTGADSTETEQALGVGPSNLCDYTQEFGSPQHSGATPCSSITQPSILAQVETDPGAPAEYDANDDLALLVNYAPTLTQGAYSYVQSKRGFTSLDDAGSQTWSVQIKKWTGAGLADVATLDSTWKPIDAIQPYPTYNIGYEQLFSPTVTAAGLYMPESAGRVSLHDAKTGALIKMINPFAGTAFDADSRLNVSNALSHDSQGNVYYHAIAWGPKFAAPMRGVWMVKVTPSGAVIAQPWAAIATVAAGYQQDGDVCVRTERNNPNPPPRPWPQLDANGQPVPYMGSCGAQMPTLNSAISFDSQDNPIVVSLARNETAQTYIGKVNKTTLTGIWGKRIANVAADGCGVEIPYGTGPYDCRPGTPLGIDPEYGTLPRGDESGFMNVSPSVAPNGDIWIAGFSGYNRNESHLIKFNRDGVLKGSYPFGWNTTPTLVANPFDPFSDYYTLVMARNHFSAETGDGTQPDSRGGLVGLNAADITEYELKYLPNDPNAFANDVTDTQIVRDVLGNFYFLRADGKVYSYDQLLNQRWVLDLGLGSIEPLETSLSWGTDAVGKPILWVNYYGFAFAIGGGTSVWHTRPHAPVTPPAPRPLPARRGHGSQIK